MYESIYLKKMVNVAIQVVPAAPGIDTYRVIDKAIGIISEAGVEYVVTPFETVMEGDYDKLMEIVKMVQDECYKNGANQVLCYIKIQSKSIGDVTINEKLGKYIKKGP